MNYYLIDYENVGQDALTMVSKASSADRIIFFYSDHCKNISLETVEMLIRRNLVLQCNKAATGSKNALDFQLAAYLGYLIGTVGKDNGFYVVSNDKGFDCLHAFWQNSGVSVSRVSELKVPAVAAATSAKVVPADRITLEEISALLLPSESPAEVLAIVNRYKTRVAINNAIMQLIRDGKKAGKIYQKLKPLLVKKHRK